VYGTLDTIFFWKIKMDSSSDFGPVGKGFMVFHFCKILGAFGKMQKMCFQTRNIAPRPQRGRSKRSIERKPGIAAAEREPMGI